MAKYTVPLVYSHQGARTEIGEAEINLETGVILAVIPKPRLEDIHGVASLIVTGTLGPARNFRSFDPAEETGEEI